MKAIRSWGHRPLQGSLCTGQGSWTCRRCLHVSERKTANPIGHPPAPGPPPKPPVPSASFEGEAVARKKKQAELLKLGQQLKANPSKPATVLQKRFWKTVSVQETDDGSQIMLDSRPVRNAAKNILKIPRNKPHLATAIALEWDSLVNARQSLKQHYIPMTSLTSRAIDIVAADKAGDTSLRDNVVTMLMGYLKTDTLLCWAPAKNIHDPKVAADAFEQQAPGDVRGESLRDRQMRTAKPIISFLQTHVWPGVELNPILETNSIIPTPQPEMTTQVIRGWVAGLPAWELAALERGVLASKSLCVATRLLVEWSHEFRNGKEHETDGDEIAKRFEIEDAAEACNLEVLWQTQMWGEVEDTHDVDKEDLRRQLGAVILLVHGETP